MIEVMLVVASCFNLLACALLVIRQRRIMYGVQAAMKMAAQNAQDHEQILRGINILANIPTLRDEA